MQANPYEVLYYIYVLCFGEYVSMKIACGSIRVRERRGIGR